jgi:RHS repeat-associated protein
VELGVSPVLRYDPLGRLVRTDHPDGTYAVTSFDPWQQTTSDRNDTVLESRWYAQRTKPLPPDVAPSKDWTAQNRAALLTARHADTPTTEHFDVLGQTVATVQRLVATGDDGENVTDTKTGKVVVKQLVTRTELDINGHVLSVTDPRGLVVERNIFDRAGSVLLQQSPDAGPRWQVGDLDGQPLLSADARGYVTRQSYDKLRRPTTRTVLDPGGSTPRVAERRVYGEAAEKPEVLNLRLQQVLVLDDAGSVQAQGFDFAGRPQGSVRRFAADAKVAPDWKDAAAHVSPAAVLQAIDDRLDDETNPSTWTWNALGKPVDATTPDGSMLRTHYDEGGALGFVELRHHAGATPYASGGWSSVAVVRYDAHGRREQVLYGNQTSTRYTYDPESFRLTGIRTTDQSGVALQDLHLVYDPQGNAVERWDAAQDKLFFANQMAEPRQTFVLDSLYRLILATGRETATPRSPIDPTGDLVPGDLPASNAGAVVPYTERYAYDLAGNLVSMSHQSTSGAWTRLYAYPTTSDGQPQSNRLASVSVAVAQYKYPHDAAGNIARMPSAGDLHWNAAGLLERAVLSGSFTSYRYGQDGLRARKHRVHTGGTPTEVEQHGAFERHRKRDYGGGVQDETELLSVSDGTGVVLRIETRVRKGGALPMTAEAAPVWRFELADALGSPTVQVNESGAVVGRLEYAPYGAMTWHGRADKEGVATSRYRFNGKAWDEETGLADYGARLYSPWLGRWTAVDPAGLVDGPSRYAYVRGNPGSLVDLDGAGAAKPDPPKVPQGLLSPDPLVREAQLRAMLAVKPGEAARPTGPTLNAAPTRERQLEMTRNREQRVAEAKAQALEEVKTVESALPVVSTIIDVADTVSAVVDVVESGGSNESLVNLGFAVLTSLPLGDLARPAKREITRKVLGLLEDASPGVKRGGKAGGAPKGADLHHVATNKNFVSTARGGPWSPRFKDMFERAGMSLDDGLNKIYISGHRGPHPEAYHEAVFERLTTATRGLSGDAYGRAFRSELEAIGKEAATPGSNLNRLLTRK